jgi:hypothetical protein
MDSIDTSTLLVGDVIESLNVRPAMRLCFQKSSVQRRIPIKQAA